MKLNITIVVLKIIVYLLVCLLLSFLGRILFPAWNVWMYFYGQASALVLIRVGFWVAGIRASLGQS